jgi:hypothetical protein
MPHPSLPPGAESLFAPDTLWWLDDRFFHFGRSERRSKPYRRPAYELEWLGPSLHVVPASRHRADERFKAWLASQPWTLRLAAGRLPGLAEDSLLLVNHHQNLPGREVVFSAPEYIGRAPDEVAGQLRTLLGEYIDACFNA